MYIIKLPDDYDESSYLQTGRYVNQALKGTIDLKKMYGSPSAFTIDDLTLYSKQVTLRKKLSVEFFQEFKKEIIYLPNTSPYSTINIGFHGIGEIEFPLCASFNCEISDGSDIFPYPQAQLTRFTISPHIDKMVMEFVFGDKDLSHPIDKNDLDIVKKKFSILDDIFYDYYERKVSVTKRMTKELFLAAKIIS